MYWPRWNLIIGASISLNRLRGVTHLHFFVVAAKVLNLNTAWRWLEFTVGRLHCYVYFTRIFLLSKSYFGNVLSSLFDRIQWFDLL